MRYRNPNHATPPAPSRPKREFQKTKENEHSHQYEAFPLKKAKRYRSAFTTEQIKYLDAEFRKYPYIGSARRKEVSNALNIPERAVKIWFQNRRMKEKKDVSIELDTEEHKNSRKTDLGSDQLSNECNVTSTNNQNYAPLPLISPNVANSVTVSIPIKKENEIDAINKRPAPRDNTGAHYKSSAEFSIELFKQYNNYIGNEEASGVRPLVEKETKSQPMTSPKREVSSTSPYDKLPQDLSSKRKEIKPVNECPTGYFPLNLKKYCAEPPLPVSSMVWKPVQVVPLVPPGAAVMKEAAGCRCDCRCGLPAAPGPALLHGASSVPQYVLTALPLQNPYYKC